MPDYIQVFTRGKFWPLEPHRGAIDLHDIAHSLSLLCRYAGHIDRFYSVAQHSIMVSLLVPAKDALWGLMHDASEAYLLDIPAPLKKMDALRPYREAEAKLMRAIALTFHMESEQPESIHEADLKARRVEAEELMSPPVDNWTSNLPEYSANDRILFKRIANMGMYQAEKAFLARYEEITGCKTPSEWR